MLAWVCGKSRKERQEKKRSWGTSPLVNKCITKGIQKLTLTHMLAWVCGKSRKERQEKKRSWGTSPLVNKCISQYDRHIIDS